MQNEFTKISYESDECLSKGICSVSPIMTSIQEIILLYLRELSFYILKLKNFGITNDEVKDAIIFALANITTNAEYSQEQFQELISTLYNYIFQSKALYEKYCLEHNVEIETTKSYFKYSKNFTLTEAIRKGEKYFRKRSSVLTLKQKNLYDIMFFIGKSLIIKMVEYKRLGKEDTDSYYTVLSMLVTIKLSSDFENLIKEEIQNAVKVYHKLCKSIFDTKVELYGEVSPAEISFSTVQGKAILVSGSDFKKLELVLNATEGTDISVYTHGVEMVMAHAFKKLRCHPNLRGHFGSGLETSMLDFASFPGAILMTKGSLQRVEYLYRGRLFTLDPLPPMGVVKIEDNNFKPLIKSALDAKGFTNAHTKPSAIVGFDTNKIKIKVNEILNKIINKEIKHLYIIGLLSIPSINKVYFQKFFELIPKDCYAISLCVSTSKKNVFHIDALYDYSLFYKIIDIISEKIPLNEANLTTFLTNCDKHTISHLLYLKNAGVKNVYTCKCPTALINPALMDTLQEVFNIKEFTDSKKDIEDTLKK